MVTVTAHRHEMRSTLAEIALILGLAATLLFQYLPLLAQASPDNLYRPGGMVEHIATGHGEDPYRGRLLVPAALWGLSRLTGLGLEGLHVAYFGVVFAVILVATRWMLTAFGFARGWAIGGAVLIAALLPTALRNHYYQPWSWAEAAFYAIAVILVLRRSSAWVFVVLVGLATLNRETALFLPLFPVAAAVARRPEPSRPYWVMAGWGAFVAITIRLVLMFVWPGPAELRAIGLDEVLARNLGTLGLAGRNVALLVGAVGVCAVMGWRRASREARWFAVFGVVPLFAIYAVFALWYEVRVLVPAVILLMPLAVGGFAPRDDDTLGSIARRGRH